MMGQAETIATEVPIKAAFCDPLLECLLLLAKLDHKPCSPTALTSGLPLINEKLTPKLFIRAAARVGMSAKIVERSLAKITNLVLPAVLLLQNNEAVVLLSINQEQQQARLLDPYTGGEKQIPLSELESEFTGFVIYTRQEHQFDRRTTDGASRPKGHWFWGVIQHSWKIYRDVLLASLFISLFAVVNPLFVMNVYDRVVPNNALETLWVLAIGVLVVYVFDFILKILRSYFIEVAGKKSDVLLSSVIFERVLGARLSDRPESVGAFASQLREFDTVRNFFTSSTITGLVDLPFTVIFLLVILFVGGPLVWVPLVAIPVIIGYALLVRRPLQESVEQTYQSSAQKNATLVETLTSLETVKALGAEGRVQRVWEKSVGHLSVWGQKSRLISNSVGSVSGAVQQVSSVFLVVVGVYLIAERELTMGALIACVMLSSRALAPMGQAASLLVNYEQTKTAMGSLETIMRREQERDEEKSYIQRSRLKGAIQFEKVSFSYPNEDVQSLHEVSFKVQPGERIAIIGRIGSGKTTLQKLMLGLYQPSEGSVLIDGIASQQIDPADLRRNMGYIPQDIALFYGTVKDNIAYGSPYADDEAIIRVANISGVSEFVNRHPSGFQRMVGERGSSLSGGQRQSIAVARALLNEPPILIMDEPTTAMDNSTEERLKTQFSQYVQGRTLILVTHKTSLLSLVDRLLVLDQGKLIADGPKESVLEALKKGQLRVQQP